MNGTLLHIGFDVIAWLAAGLSLLWLTRHVRIPPAPTGASFGCVASKPSM